MLPQRVNIRTPEALGDVATVGLAQRLCALVERHARTHSRTAASVELGSAPRGVRGRRRKGG